MKVIDGRLPSATRTGFLMNALRAPVMGIAVDEITFLGQTKGRHNLIGYFWGLEPSIDIDRESVVGAIIDHATTRIVLVLVPRRSIRKAGRP